MRIFRRATMEDLEQCWSVVDAARWQMIRIGRKQWTPEYPSREVLAADIEAGAGFVIEEEDCAGGNAAEVCGTEGKTAGVNAAEVCGIEGKAAGVSAAEGKATGGNVAEVRGIVAYGAVYRNGEPEYERLRGNWLSHGDYLVVHRLAVDPKWEKRGLARGFFANVERMALEQSICSVKVDTNYDNAGMQHILATSGYVHCGEVTYPVSGERLAYEKLLP